MMDSRGDLLGRILRDRRRHRGPPAKPGMSPGLPAGPQQSAITMVASVLSLDPAPCQVPGR